MADLLAIPAPVSDADLWAVLEREGWGEVKPCAAAVGGQPCERRGPVTMFVGTSRFDVCRIHARVLSRRGGNLRSGSDAFRVAPNEIEVMW